MCMGLLSFYLFSIIFSINLVLLFAIVFNEIGLKFSPWVTPRKLHTAKFGVAY